MSVKERIIMLDLIKKKNSHQEFFNEIGVTVSMNDETEKQKTKEDDDVTIDI